MIPELDDIIEQLAHTGYIVLDNPLPCELTMQLLTRCQEDGQSQFLPAHVGRGAEKKQISSIRGDVICWLDESHPVDQAYLNWMEALRSGLNAALYLGLFDFECHYAIYHSGAGYAKHSDVLAGKRNRILSTVLYLNEHWQADDGGELVLFGHEGNDVISTVRPEFGTMIIFLSESFPHEVLPSNKTRRSIAGWFRVSGS